MKSILKTMKKFAIVTAGLFLGVISNLRPVGAISHIQAGALAAKANDQPLYLFGATGIFSTITSSAMFLIGAICVLMMVAGGFKYVISGGDATKVTAAKNTILYAIIGVVVAIMAYAIISFIINTLATDSPAIMGTNL